MRAIAIAWCELAGEFAPATGAEASDLIDRLRSQEPDVATPIVLPLSASDIRDDDGLPTDLPAYG